METARTRRAAGPLDAYLSEIDATPLLTAADERRLAHRVACGDTAARDQLVRANLRLTVHLAREYAGKGLPMEDLIAEGNMGLIRAAEGFDPDAGTRFSTYASYWIKQSMRRALSRDGNTVRLPSYVTALVARWQRASAGLRRELGRAPTDEEVAVRLDLSPRRLRVVRKALRAYTPARAADDEESGGVLDGVAEAREGCPAEGVAGADLVRAAVRSLDLLSEREAAVLRMRFGLGGTEPVTLREVGARLGYTRERVRQIERDALAKLRQHIAA